MCKLIYIFPLFFIFYFSMLAVKEFAFMKALHAHGFPTPTPIDQSRHIVAMSKIEGKEHHDNPYLRYCLVLCHLPSIRMTSFISILIPLNIIFVCCPELNDVATSLI